MPRFEDLLGGRQDGQPTKPPVPGAPPGVSTPSGPNPTSVNSSAPGRPSNPPFAGSSTPPGTAVANKASGAGGQSRDPETYEEQKQPELQRQVLMLSKIPSRSEMMDLSPDNDYETPYGKLGEDGEIAFSPEGEQKYNEQVVHARKRFGATPFADDPNAPQLDVKLGKDFINPFTGESGRF